MSTVSDKIKAWGAESWWHLAIVNVAGAIVGVLLLSPLAVKYLPPQAINAVTTEVASTHVVAVGISDSVVVSGTVVQ